MSNSGHSHQKAGFIRNTVVPGRYIGSSDPNSVLVSSQLRNHRQSLKSLRSIHKVGLKSFITSCFIIQSINSFEEDYCIKSIAIFFDELFISLKEGLNHISCINHAYSKKNGPKKLAD